MPDLEAFARKVRDAGVDIREIVVKDAGHGWERECPYDSDIMRRRDEVMQIVVSRLKESWIA